MAIGSGPTQVPAYTLPHSTEGKSEFESSRRFDLSFAGLFGIVFLGAALLIFLVTLRTDLWYVGVALLGLAAVFFTWPLIRGTRPK